MPITLSFFCAGTPSQHVTEDLAQSLAADASSITELRYRGNGWPGSFTVKSEDGSVGSMSYDESWGNHLGRNLQWRCKLCVDGTGGHADISVGDYWKADASGYPIFNDADGNSVAIARTQRGHNLLMRAHAEGVITLSSLQLDDVAGIQPLQVERKATLVGRLAGRVLSGKSIPRYRGYRLDKAAKGSARANLKALIGTYLRSVNLRH